MITFDDLQAFGKNHRHNPDDCEVAAKNPHQLLMEMVMGKWRDHTDRARAHLTYKVMKNLGIDHRHTGESARSWLEDKEKRSA